MNLSLGQREYIRSILQDSIHVRFNDEIATFDVLVDNPNWQEVQSIAAVIKKLRNIPPPDSGFVSIPLDEIKSGYYDRCLQEYCFERLICHTPHSKTCFIRNAKQTQCLGRLPRDQGFNDDEKDRFLSNLGETRKDFISQSICRAYRSNPGLRESLIKDEEGWILFHADIPIKEPMQGNVLNRFLRRSWCSIKGVSGDARILSICRSIERHGWDNSMSNRKHSLLLGYSMQNNRHFVLTGRHRIAALKYLRSQNRIEGNTMIECSIVRYPWDSWLWGRPFPGIQLCPSCDETMENKE